jgi:hypothetical protein
VVLLKLENSDLAGNAWTTGVQAATYTIKQDNTWEPVIFDFTGAGTAQGQTADVTTDPTFSNDYYNVVRIMLNSDTNNSADDFYFDELQGPSVEGIKSAQF